MAERTIKRIYNPDASIPKDPSAVPKRRVAAYVRVSTASDEQLNSIVAQKDYFGRMIRRHPDWLLVDIYADEGLSGTSIRNREGFNRMIADALAGEIDIIITKSTSRFARNTVDTLNTIRQLKEHSVEVFFEREEAAIVIRIYREFMGGKTLSAIARRLTEDGIPTPGKKTVWQSSTVRSILTNEKYKGSALLQKKYTVDFLSKTMKVNEGEVPQYYVEESHPAIIQSAEWEAVQIELAQRKARGRRHDCHTPFSGKIICGDCGSVFGSKVWHSTSKYRQTIWQCNHKFDGEEKCSTPHLRESVIKDRFQQALGEYMADPEERIEGLRYAKKAMTDTDFIDADIDQAEKDLELISGLIRNCISMNATAALTETEYRQQYAELTQQYETKKAEYDALLAEKDSREALDVVFSGILFQLTELQELPAEFKDSLWHTLVDHVTVYNDERIAFTFKDETEIVTML